MGVKYRSLRKACLRDVAALAEALQQEIDVLQGKGAYKARKTHRAFEYHAFALLFYLMHPSLDDKQKQSVAFHTQSMAALGHLKQKDQVIDYLKAFLLLWEKQVYFNPFTDSSSAESESHYDSGHWKNAKREYDSWGVQRSLQIKERLEVLCPDPLTRRTENSDDFDAVPDDWRSRPASLTYADMLMSEVYHHHTVEGEEKYLSDLERLKLATWYHQKAAFAHLRKNIGAENSWQDHALWVLHMEGALKISEEDDKPLSDWCKELLSSDQKHKAYNELEYLYQDFYDKKMNLDSGDQNKRYALFSKKFYRLHWRYFNLALHRLGDRIGRPRFGKRMVWQNKAEYFGLKQNDRLFPGVFSDYFKAFHQHWVDQSKLVAALTSLHKVQKVLSYEQRVLCKSLVQAFRKLESYKDFSFKQFENTDASDRGNLKPVDIDPTEWKEHYGDLLICSIWLNNQGNPVMALTKIKEALEQAGPGFFHRVWIYFKQCFFAMTHWAGFTTQPGYSVEQVHARAKASAFEGVMGDIKHYYGEDPTAGIGQVPEETAPSAQKV